MPATEIASERAFVGAALVAGSLALTPVAVYAVRGIFRGRNVFFARWGFTHFALVVAVYVAASLLVGDLFLAGGLGLVPTLIGAAGINVLCGLVILTFARRLDPDGLRCLGFRSGSNGRAIVAGAVAYALLLPGLFGLGWCWPWLLERLGGTYAPQSALLAFAQLSGPVLWVATLLAVVVVPFLEELIFRGFVQPLLVQNFRDAGGVVLTSILFALLHGSNAFLPVFGLSLVLGGVMLRTQRLAAPWVIHALNNALAIVLIRHFPELSTT